MSQFGWFDTKDCEKSPEVMERTKKALTISEEDKLRYILDGLMNYRRQSDALKRTYESLANQEISLPLKEVYEVEEIASLKERKDRVQKEQKSITEELGNLKKLRQDAKKMIAEYLPVGMKMRWEHKDGEVYIVETVSYDRDVPDIKIEREE